MYWNISSLASLPNNFQTHGFLISIGLYKIVKIVNLITFSLFKKNILGMFL